MSKKRGDKTSEKKKSEEVEREGNTGNKNSKLQQGREGYTEVNDLQQLLINIIQLLFI